MLLTTGTYAIFFGWPFAFGVVGLIFCHECGHAVVLHHYGVPFSPMVFVPFVGAVIVTKDNPRSALEDALIAFGGPVVGGVAAVGVAAVASSTDSQLLYALADFGYMINIFNMMPLGLTDGGRIASAISPYINGVGILGGGYLAYSGMIANPLFYLILLGGGYNTASRIFGWDDVKKDFYNISGAKQLCLTAGFVSVLAGLLYGMAKNNEKRKTPKQLQYEVDTGVEMDPWSSSADGKYDDFFADSKY